MKHLLLLLALGGFVQAQDCASVVSEARQLMAQRRYPQADSMSEAALAQFPSCANLLALRGQLLTMKGQPADGRVMLERALKLDPNNADAHFNLGAQFDRTKQYSDAVAHFQKVVQIDPKNPRAWDYLGLNLEPLGEVARAEEAFRRGLAVNEGPLFDSYLEFNYGRLLLKLNRLNDSKTHLDRAVDLVPRSRAIRYERAKLNLRLRQYEIARQDAEAARELADPAGAVIDLQVYALLEQIYRRMGNAEMAAKYADLTRATPVPPRDRAGR